MEIKRFIATIMWQQQCEIIESIEQFISCNIIIDLHVCPNRIKNAPIPIGVCFIGQTILLYKSIYNKSSLKNQESAFCSQQIIIGFHLNILHKLDRNVCKPRTNWFNYSYKIVFALACRSNLRLWEVNFMQVVVHQSYLHFTSSCFIFIYNVICEVFIDKSPKC